MSAAAALVLALAVGTSTSGPPALLPTSAPAQEPSGEVPACAIEACPPAVLRRLWLAERRARILWEVVADHRRRELEDARAELAERRSLLRSAPAPPPCPTPTTCPWPWVAGGACAACAAGAAAGCVILSR